MRRSSWGVGAEADNRACEFYEWVGFTRACQYYCRVSGAVASGLRKRAGRGWWLIVGGWNRGGWAVDGGGGSGGGSGLKEARSEMLRTLYISYDVHSYKQTWNQRGRWVGRHNNIVHGHERPSKHHGFCHRNYWKPWRRFRCLNSFLGSILKF